MISLNDPVFAWLHPGSWSLLPVGGLFLSATLSGWADPGGTPGATRIAEWKGDRKAAFMLLFDDGSPTHLNVVIPELKKRQLVGTFYLNPGVSWYMSLKPRWEAEAVAAGMVFGNHTMTHEGATNAAMAEAGIAACNDYLATLQPGPKTPSLRSYATPGGVTWKVPPGELAHILDKHHLIARPPSNGRFAGIHLKTAEALVSVIDRALAKGGMEALYFHGVGGDWLSQPKEDFIKAVDTLCVHRDDLWITDPVSAQKYETERKAAQVSVVAQEASSIRLRLTASVDLALYDEPLSLITAVPGAWKACRVSQAGRTVTVKVVAGTVRYEALPGRDEILLTRDE